MKINLLQFIVEIHKDSSFLDKTLGLFSSFRGAVLKAGAAGRSGRARQGSRGQARGRQARRGQARGRSDC